MTQQHARQSRYVHYFMVAVLLVTLALGIYATGLWVGVLLEMIL